MVGLSDEKFAPLSEGGIISVVGGQIRAASPMFSCLALMADIVPEK